MPKLPAERLKHFYQELLQSWGVPASHSNAMARMLVRADLRGLDSHGAARLTSLYLPLIKSGKVQWECEPERTHQNMVVQHIDGRRCLGAYTGTMAMERAIEQADRMEAGIVSAYNSTHFGFASYYSLMAAEAGFVGITVTNGGPAVPAPGGSQALFGTNALALALPSPQGKALVLDISLSEVSLGQLYMLMQDQEKVPASFAADHLRKARGLSRDDLISPKMIYDSRMVAPLGGGHKGFLLGFLLEFLLAFVGAGNFSFEQVKGEASHLFVALDPERFMSSHDYQHIFQRSRKIFDPSPGGENGTLRWPGSRSHDLEQQRLQEGIPLPEWVWEELLELSPASLAQEFLSAVER